MAADKNKSQWVHCNDCSHDTDHRVLFDHRNKEFEHQHKDDQGQVINTMDGFHDWVVLECQGCKTVCLRSGEYFSERACWWEDDPFIYTYFPKRNTAARDKPHWYYRLIRVEKLQGHFILTAYDQIYALIEGEHYLAAVLTCRALLETVAIEHTGPLQSFEKKLIALTDMGFVRPSQIDFLNTVIYDAGSAAMHRGYNPSKTAVTFMLDAVEHLLYAIYIEPDISAELAAEKPLRKRPTK